ncbi:hypothetical protein [Calycomorphotria hydatis]|uniref:Uncharacterized protein n=1 Tax=Calycomorphotria hydatis TaxID=2528027 RepID=A0A517T3E2_9PLAN|nr:hypothetical protein [Calycomorphotria hydatis]QDT62898.1 hypothetical protein V22_00960 [Calycomorphotria hydatis]
MRSQATIRSWTAVATMVGMYCGLCSLCAEDAPLVINENSHSTATVTLSPTESYAEPVPYLIEEPSNHWLGWGPFDSSWVVAGVTKPLKRGAVERFRQRLVDATYKARLQTQRVFYLAFGQTYYQPAAPVIEPNYGYFETCWRPFPELPSRCELHSCPEMMYSGSIPLDDAEVLIIPPAPDGPLDDAKPLEPVPELNAPLLEKPVQPPAAPKPEPGDELTRLLDEADTEARSETIVLDENPSTFSNNDVQFAVKDFMYGTGSTEWKMPKQRTGECGTNSVQCSFEVTTP